MYQRYAKAPAQRCGQEKKPLGQPLAWIKNALGFDGQGQERFNRMGDDGSFLIGSHSTSV
jgi:hypothetical protein